MLEVVGRGTPGDSPGAKCGALRLHDDAAQTPGGYLPGVSLSYAIIGTGALGGYYGGQLARSGQRVHFLLHSDFEHVQQHGLRVHLAVPGSDTTDSYTVTPETHDVTFHGDADEMPAADVVLICLKTTQNHLLPKLLPTPGSKRWKAGTIVVTLQNGLHPERDAAAVVGDEHVAGGLCFLCTNKVGPGHIKYLDYGFIKLGSLAQKPSTNMLEKLPGVAADFRGAGVDCNVVDDLVLARWQKLVWNVPYNGLSVVLNMTTDKMMANPNVRRRVVALMHEVAAAAKAVDGKTIDDTFIHQMLTNTEKMAPYKTSMMLDYEAGREMEVEAIVGDPMRSAQTAEEGIALEIKRLYSSLKTIDYGFIGKYVSQDNFGAFTSHKGVAILHVDATWDHSGWPQMVDRLRALRDELPDTVQFGFLDADSGDLAKTLNVTAIPMVILFLDGVPTGRHVGYELDIKPKVEALLNRKTKSG